MPARPRKVLKELMDRSDLKTTQNYRSARSGGATPWTGWSPCSSTATASATALPGRGTDFIGARPGQGIGRGREAIAQERCGDPG